MALKLKLFSKKDKKGGGKAASVKIPLTILEKSHRDWRNLLLSAVVLGIMVVALDGYLLWRVNSGDIFTTETVTETNTTATDKKTLENVVKFFEGRAEAFEKFKSTPRTEIDPSL